MNAQGRAYTLEDAQTWRQQLVRGVLRAVAIAGVLVAAAGSYDAYVKQTLWTVPFYWGAFGIVVFLLFWRQAPYTLQVWAIIGLLYVLSFTDFIEDGLGGSGRVFILVIPFLAGIFLGRRESVIALALIFFTMAGFGWAFCTGLIPTPEGSPAADPARWISGTLVVLLLGTLFVVCLDYLVPRLVAALAESRKLAQEQERRAIAEREQRAHLQSTVAGYGDHMAEVARGNLATRLPLTGNELSVDDPLIVLGYNLNETTASLQQMTLQVRETARDLNAAVAEILAASTQQASGISQQSAAMAQTTTTVDEVKTIAEQAVARVQEVANISQRAVEVSHAGERIIQDAIGNMGGIEERVQRIAENILALAEKTQQIGKIIATVSDIAAQSNILALNASVEAARAGKYGKGFAVVAGEVRNLAEQSHHATEQVRAILLDILKATNATVMATEEGTNEVRKGVRLAAEVQSVLEQLAIVIEESAQVARQVVAGGRQHAMGVEQIATAMQNINQATAQNLSSTRQTEKAARNLSELARSLTETVEQYQL
jgi:methyl-accepting chemotaxis protein